ncbi:MAG: apolipoprotein N-acyltransferase [Phycisphaerae bacterium]
MKPTVARPSRSAEVPADQTLPQVLLAGESDIRSRWPILLMAAVSWVLSLPLFAPWGFWPAGYVAFVPWLLALALSARSAWVYLVSYLLGAAFYLMHFRWLYDTTPEMYVVACLLYVAPLFVPAAWITRHLCRTRGWCLTFAFPLAWTAQELVHSRGPLAFPWFLLGHSQYRFLTAIQIADLAGAYGVSFVLAAVNGLIADLLLRLFRRKPSKAENPWRIRRAGAFAAGLVGFTLLYGQYRLHQGGQVEGPKVAVVQGDFPLVPFDNPNAPSENEKRFEYIRLAREALADDPDLIVLPETPWAMYLNPEALADGGRTLLAGLAWTARHNPRARQTTWSALHRLSALSDREFRNLAALRGIPIVVGGMSLMEDPDPQAYPRFHKFNSAFVYPPEGGPPARYDKINLVLFGEYVPFRYSWYGLYRFMNDHPWNPWGKDGDEYSLTPGREYTTFPLRLKSRPRQPVAFGVTICYEDVVPQVFRRFILDGQGHKRTDFMLNISNDGWFGYGTQQAQHLVNCSFRAVENRVSVARSVNTGVSGFIHPDGSRHDLVGNGPNGLRAGGAGWRSALLPIDPRVTFYSRFGDALPAGWSLLSAAALLDAGRTAWKNRRRSTRRTRRERKGKT